MRLSALMGSLLLGVVAAIGPVSMPARADSARPACPCNCPDDHKIKPPYAEARPAPRHSSRHYAAGHYYNYREATPVHWRAAHGPWRAAPGVIEPEGLVIDRDGWTGGVGYGEEGGGGGYGQLLLANGNGQNGPTYNSLGESFQQNPSMPHPFQSRLMGGLAPSGTGSK